ncbi:MAG: hypothetical protein NC120_11215, partial [Ruminococcus sp.]|nr:hypothetical protein [Ruminococcus sp.]
DIFPKKKRAEKKKKEKKSGKSSSEAEAKAAEGKPPEREKEKPPEKDAAEKTPDGSGKPPFYERIGGFLDGLEEKKRAVRLLFELIMPPLKGLGKKLRIDDIKLDFAAASEDAAEAAILYGKLNAAVYNAISAVRCFISISLISVNIDCLYNTPAEKCRYDGECRIKLRPVSLISAILAVLLRYGREKEKYSAVLTLMSKDNEK